MVPLRISSSATAVEIPEAQTSGHAYCKHLIKGAGQLQCIPKVKISWKSIEKQTSFAASQMKQVPTAAT
jgi:hypothetical protein